MSIIMAPMEGVFDYHFRELLTQIGGFDLCVTEFIRVSNTIFPAKVFKRYCPELSTGGRTTSGVPVIVQLMGGNPELLADNAAKAASLGALGIDLNFGCPAKLVNRRDAGSSLLQYPERIQEIVAAVRASVPEQIPVTAKIRLGYQDKSLAIENAHAVQQGGAASIVVHARTKKEGYRPPAHWDWIARIRKALTIPVVANGDIWSLEDYKKCKEVSGCQDVMLGRGAMAYPELALEISKYNQGEAFTARSWSEIQDLILHYFQIVEAAFDPRYVHGRIKQWIKHLGRTYPESHELFLQIREERDVVKIKERVTNFLL